MSYKTRQYFNSGVNSDVFFKLKQFQKDKIGEKVKIY